jgi:hypothetical protein
MEQQMMHLAEDDVQFPTGFPDSHIGPVALPGTGRMVYWTGRVAIGLRHEPARRDDQGVYADWLQELICPRLK